MTEPVVPGWIVGGNFTRSYDAEQLVVNRQTTPVQPMAISSASVTPAAFTIDENGALSIDPGTATIGMSFRSQWPIEMPPFSQLDNVEILYGTSILFQGFINQISVTVQREGPGVFTHSYSLALRSTIAKALDGEPTPVPLPAEAPLERLRRWFTVDIGLMTPAQLAWLNGLTQPAIDATEQTYLSWAREFTLFTKLPLRNVISSPPQWNHVQILPNPIVWNGESPTPNISSTDPSWINELVREANNSTDGYLMPTSVAVTANDARFLIGYGDVDVDQGLLGSDFTLGVTRIGESGSVPVGLSAGAVASIYGDMMVIERITHSFGHEKYVASMELSIPVRVNI